MTTTSSKKKRSTAHTLAANLITQTFDAVSREKRQTIDRVLRSTIFRGKNASESQQLRRVLASDSTPLFSIDPDLGYTSFKWPADQLDLVSQAIENTQKIKDLDIWEGKSYFRSMRSLDGYSLDSPEMQLATSEAMLKSVAQYLGRLPMLLDISARISLSDADTPGAKLSGSQMFHRDMDDVASVKVWILCSDVKSENGPTVLLPTKISHDVARKIAYKQGDKIPDDVPFSEHQADLFEATGPVGTTFATDTCSSFHYGSRTEVSKERLVLYFQYVTSTSVYFRPLGERAGKRKNKFFQVPPNANLTNAQRTLLRGYL